MRGIAAGLRAHIEAVEPHAGITEDAIKLQGDMLTIILGWDIDDLAIPAYTRLWILVAHSLITM